MNAKIVNTVFDPYMQFDPMESSSTLNSAFLDSKLSIFLSYAVSFQEINFRNSFFLPGTSTTLTNYVYRVLSTLYRDYKYGQLGVIEIVGTGAP